MLITCIFSISHNVINMLLSPSLEPVTVWYSNENTNGTISVVIWEDIIDITIKQVAAVSTAEPHSSVSSIEDLRKGGHGFDPPAQPIFFPRIDDGHCDRIHSSLTAVHCLNNGYMGKQPVGSILCGVLVKPTPGKHG